MWYDETKGLPDPVVATAMHQLGPSFDKRGVPMEDRITVLWDEKDGGKNPTYANGYLFASPAALRDVRLDPLMIPLPGRRAPYTAKAAGYIGEPDGDRLTYEWMSYPEAGSYRGPLEIKDSTKPAASLTAPEVEGPQEAHVILKVRDAGSPPLTRYRRVRIMLKPAGAKADSKGGGR